MVTLGKFIAGELRPPSKPKDEETENLEISTEAPRPTLNDYMTIHVSGPIFEETLFRLAPSLIFGNDWVVGLIAAVVFAGIHNINKDRSLDFSKIPIPQFLGGVYYWFLLRDRGIDHAMLAHINNNVMLSIAQYLEELFPKPK